MLHFWVTFAFRYYKTLRNVWLSHQRRPTGASEKSNFSVKDSTVVIATVGGSRIDKLAMCIKSCLSNNVPSVPRIIVATIADQKAHITSLTKSLSPDIEVIATEKPNKKAQLCKAFSLVTTPVTVSLDDDVEFSDELFSRVLVAFDESIGALGTLQKIKHQKTDLSTLAAHSKRLFHELAHLPPSLYRICQNLAAVAGEVLVLADVQTATFLGEVYLEGRNIEISATSTCDETVRVLSGRAQFLRTSIVASSESIQALLEESNGELRNTDDDNIITEIIKSHGLKIVIQPEFVETTLEPTCGRYTLQTLRWLRTSWRRFFQTLSSLKSQERRSTMMKNKWTTYIWVLSILWLDPSFFVVLLRLSGAGGQAYVLFCGWILVLKTVKLWRIFSQSPIKIALLPLALSFGLFQSLLKLYALLTMSDDSWGNLETS